MSWRVAPHLIRGEIDNRIRGRVTGRFWFTGRSAPVEIELRGNANRDLAGAQLYFINPAPRLGLDPSFETQQIGVIGEFTASRKMRIPEIPLEDFPAQKSAFSCRLGNGVYFEWFSLANGRVVIESADFQLTIDPETSWAMTEQEEIDQREAHSRAIETLLEKLGFLSEPTAEEEIPNAIENGSDLPGDTFWKKEDEPPISEDEADELLADSERLTDRLIEHLSQSGDNADLEKILEEELERRCREAEDFTLPRDAEAEREAWTEEVNRAAMDAAELDDLSDSSHRRHPLAERARDLTVRILGEIEKADWAIGTAGEQPLLDLVRSIAKAGGKLRGALSLRDWPPVSEECALSIAWLKRARGFLIDAGNVTDFCRRHSLAPLTWIRSVECDLGELQQETDLIIRDLRERLERGFD